MLLLKEICIIASCLHACVDAAPGNLNPFTIGLRSAIASSRTLGGFTHKKGSSINGLARAVGFSTVDAFDYPTNDDDDDLYEGNTNSQRIAGRSRRSRDIGPSSTAITNIVSSTSSKLKETKKQQQTVNPKLNRGGGPTEVLSFYENMICGAVSRSIAQVATHPANTMKTLLQSNRGTGKKISIASLAKPQNLKLLTRGAGAQFILSIPHGAANFAVLEYVRKRMNSLAMQSEWLSEKSEKSAAFGPLLDFCSSAVATVCCSVISTPQMMVVDNIMAGTYENFPKALIGLTNERGIAGFYGGWWPGLVGKIPSYALTWTLFQQLKQAQLRLMDRSPKDIENSIMGCMAAATTVCVMIPMDTIKTRLVTQMNYPDLVPYKGIIDCAKRIASEEGMGTFYRGLPPRLISVVPMIGIQFGVYEFMKKVMVSKRQVGVIEMREQHRIEKIIMEVAADDDQPFPVPIVEELKTVELKKRRKGRC